MDTRFKVIKHRIFDYLTKQENVLMNKVALLFTILLSFGMHLSVCQAIDLKKEDIISGIKKRHEILDNANIKLTLKELLVDRALPDNHSLQDPIKSSVINIHKKGDMLRLEKDIEYLFDESPGNQYDIVAWNNKIVTGYTYLKDDSDLKTGIISNDLDRQGGVVAGYPLTVVEHYFFDHKQSFAELVDLSSWEIGLIEHEGEKLYSLKSKSVVNDFGFIEVWVDPIKDFAPIYYKCVIQSEIIKPIILEMKNVKLFQANGFWLIRSAQIEVDNKNVPDYDNVIGRNEYEIQEYDIETVFPDQYFKIEFPEGTRVLDTITNIPYIYGKNNTPVKMYVFEEDNNGEKVDIGNIDEQYEDVQTITQPKKIANTSMEDSNQKQPIDIENHSDGTLKPSNTASYSIFFIIIVILVIVLSGVIYKYVYNSRGIK